MEAKAAKYAAMKRGDFSSLTERELEEGVLDVSSVRPCSCQYDRWQDAEEDEDESSIVPETLNVSGHDPAHLRTPWN